MRQSPTFIPYEKLLTINYGLSFIRSVTRCKNRNICQLTVPQERRVAKFRQLIGMTEVLPKVHSYFSVIGDTSTGFCAGRAARFFLDIGIRIDNLLRHGRRQRRRRTLIYAKCTTYK